MTQHDMGYNGTQHDTTTMEHNTIQLQRDTTQYGCNTVQRDTTQHKTYNGKPYNI